MKPVHLCPIVPCGEMGFVFIFLSASSLCCASVLPHCHVERSVLYFCRQVWKYVHYSVLTVSPLRCVRLCLSFDCSCASVQVLNGTVGVYWYGWCVMCKWYGWCVMCQKILCFYQLQAGNTDGEI